MRCTKSRRTQRRARAPSSLLATTGPFNLCLIAPDRVLILHNTRSLVTTLGAAEKWEKSHLESEIVAPLVEGAKVFYVEGYFLTHGVESIAYLSQKASAASKVCPRDHRCPTAR